MPYGSPPTPIGRLLFAEAYLRGALALLETDTGAVHRDSPVRFLYIHAIELTFKALLALNEKTDADLRKLNHSLRAVAKQCEPFGLRLSAEEYGFLSVIDESGHQNASRYLRVGSARFPDFFYMHQTARYWFQFVCLQFKRAGIPLRPDVSAIPHHPKIRAEEGDDAPGQDELNPGI